MKHARPQELPHRVRQEGDGMSWDDSDYRAARRHDASSALAALAERQRDHPMVVLLDDVDPAVGNSLFGGAAR